MKTEFSIFNKALRPLKIDANFRSFDHLRDLLILTNQKIKVLVVVDTSVQFSETGGFGVGRFVKLLRETTVGCTSFEVDIAVRPTVVSVADINFEVNPTPTVAQPHKYLDFRFDSQISGDYVLNKYQEVFMFGFAPDNAAGPDTNITNHPWYSTDAELEVLHDWMNQGGGVFATGDHDYLGASMCHRIPRVGTMRKWTNADGVPPIGGPTRLDTNRPANANQTNGVSTIPNTNEGDAVAQDIEWIPEKVIRRGLSVSKLPHKILCHPTHGPIDVMPDHPHEGCCVEPSEIDIAANVKFGDMADVEYPTIDGFQPTPKIIAYGNVIARQNLAKGPVNANHFPMISVYDGRENNTSKTGRVVVDSTWHHWFNMNINGFEAAVDKTNWDKITRYYINIALWIAPKSSYRHYCWWEVFTLHFEYPGLREINKKTPLLEVGSLVRDTLYKKLGPCWVTEFVLNNICITHPKIYNFYRDLLKPERLFNPLDPVCLTCPPLDTLELLVLGHVYRSLDDVAAKTRFAFSTKKPDSNFTVKISEIEKIAQNGVDIGMKEFANLTQTGIKGIKDIFVKQ